MSDTATIEQKQPQIVSVGKPEVMRFNMPVDAPANEVIDNAAGADTPIVDKIEETEKSVVSHENIEKIEPTAKESENIAAGLNADGTPKEVKKTVDELTDAELKELYDKKFPTQAAKTEEQLKADETAFETRMLNEYLSKGGTVENYAHLKNAVSMDLTEMTKVQLEAELKAAGFNDEERKIIQRERYYQIEQEELDDIYDEEEKALKIKAKDYEGKKLLSKAERTKQQAQSVFDNLKQAIINQDRELSDEKELASNMDAHFETLPRTLTLQLEKTPDGVDNAPIEVSVPEEIVAEVRDLLKNSDTRNNFIYKQDDSLNFEQLSEALIKSKLFDKAVADNYLKGVSIGEEAGKNKQVAIFEKTFPIRNANALGVNGSGSTAKVPTGNFGKVVSAGQPQKFKPAKQA